MSSTLTPLNATTRLAVDRTYLAHERTMMAWVRTAASMISFGFTVYKFFQLELGDRAAAGDRLVGARGFAFMLIVVGLISLMLGFIEHRYSLRLLRDAYGDVFARSIAGVVAALVAVCGLVAIVLIMFRQ